MKKTIKYLLLLLLIVSCTNYQTEYRDDAIREHKNVYGFSDLNLDDDEILKQVNAECEFIEEGIDDHIADDLPIYYFIDFYYIIQRNSGKEAQGVQSYMEAIFNYCNFSSELEDNWESLEAREESYKKFNS
tara:strand:- start:55583 stop:55975 length:393 start_codon:yes stop_codon:yes gene_type:complete